MHPTRIIVAACLLGLAALPASAQSRSREYGARASVGLATGDLRDTTSNSPCYDLGAFADFHLAENQVIQARLDGLFFPSEHKQSKGTSGGNPWVRDLDTRVKAWTLGAEYLVRPFQGLPRLQLGGGVHLVHWTVDNSSVLTLTVGATSGSVAENSRPTWNKVGLSVVTRYQLSRHLGAEARLLSSAYGWEGERVQVGQLGLSWTF